MNLGLFVDAGGSGTVPARAGSTLRVPDSSRPSPAARACRSCLALIIVSLFIQLCAGETRILDPFAIYGYVTSREGRAVGSGITVTVISEETGESLTTHTNDQGQYIVDLSTLPSGYANGDLITVNANDGQFLGTGSTRVNLSHPGLRVDVSLRSPIGTARGWEGLYLYAALGLLLLLGGYGALAAVRRWRRGGPGKEELMEVLTGEEKRVVEILREKGDLTQAEIREAGGFSDATLSRTISGLSSRGIVRKHRMGRVNMIALNDKYR